MSVKAYTNAPSDKPPDYYSVESSEVASQSRATRSSKPTELYEYSPKKALRRLSGKFKKLTFKDTQKYKRFSSSSSTLSSEPDKEFEDSVFPSPKAESYELGLEPSAPDLTFSLENPVYLVVKHKVQGAEAPEVLYHKSSTPKPHKNTESFSES